MVEPGDDSNGSPTLTRSIGLFGATGVGVGAIVGGGILVLGGVALAETGPSAIVAFAVNGFVATLTALSFAELSSAFPQSGGAYTYAKKVLSVRSAFAVGWVLWFASIVAAVLYALGFATYAVLLVHSLAELAFGDAPLWLHDRAVFLLLATGATAFYVVGLIRKAGGGGNWDTIGKVVVFLILIVFGLLALLRRSPDTLADSLVPFFTSGAGGLVTAMGFTFIALQGFDLIAAVGGEVKNPQKTIPRAMLLSLGAALLIYLPLLFLVSTVGVAPGESVADAAAAKPETLFATAAERFMGWPGFWLVVVAAILSTLTALKANLFAASRVALTMAQDRTLPAALGRIHPSRGTPGLAIYATALTLFVILFMLPDVAAAGASASLIFLISFALVHWTALLARRRAKIPAPFRAPLFPLVPVAGGLACATLAVFQAVMVPSAGIIALVWLGAGVMLYMAVFSGRAQVVDAFTEAHDPRLVRLRGRNPLALVPIANPSSAAALVEVANALTPPGIGRVLLLSVVAPPGDSWQGKPPQQLISAQEVIHEAMMESFRGSIAPQALITISAQPWREIGRVSRQHDCESLVLGLSNLADQLESPDLEHLISEVDCDVTILHAPDGWDLGQVKRILVPLGGRSGQDILRARLLGAMGRGGGREVQFLRVLHPDDSEEQEEEALDGLLRIADEEAPGFGTARVIRSDDPGGAIVEAAFGNELTILGVQRLARRHKAFGPVSLRIARDAPCATILVSRAG
jgi:basic amino acid/polyamine antiporter, APA family